MRRIIWNTAQRLHSKSFKCGYCGHPLASQEGFQGQLNPGSAYIFICHHCTYPTFFCPEGKQIPGPVLGSPVEHIPNDEVEFLFNEAKSCFSIGAYTSCVMCCRKLLMNIAVAEGADEGNTYYEYVTFLDNFHYLPPKGKPWVDKIRQLGNEANHKIEMKSVEDATLILNFTEMLLRFIYELPGTMRGEVSGESEE